VCTASGDAGHHSQRKIIAVGAALEEEGGLAVVSTERSTAAELQHEGRRWLAR